MERTTGTFKNCALTEKKLVLWYKLHFKMRNDLLQKMK